MHRRSWIGRAVAGVLVPALALGACSTGSSHPPVDTRAAGLAPSSASTTPGGAAPSQPSSASAQGHVVVVVLENRSYSDIIGNPDAAYLNSLARSGVDLTRMHAVTHPSQPNYVALFSGGLQGVTGDACPQHLTGGNLGSQLRAARLSFAGYAEGLPGTGSLVCTSGSYARRHVPWTDFAALPASTNRPFTAFPHDFARLPTVSFVVPDLEHDMHDGTVAQADTWVRSHLSSYATWARSHGSLLVVTWDEDDRSEGNRIPTIVVGAGVRARPVSQPESLYSLLRLIEDRYRLPRLGGAARAPGIPLS